MRILFQRRILVCLLVLLCSATVSAGGPNQARAGRLRTATHGDNLAIPPGSPAAGNASATPWIFVVRLWQRIFAPD